MSTRSGASAAALRMTNGPAARRDLAWIMRAATSLPEPGGPLIMMREPVGATRSIAWRTRIMAGALPISSVSSKASVAQLQNLAPQLAGLERALDRQQQPVGLERLLDEVVGTLLDRRHRGLDRAVAAEHDHR